MTKQDFLNGKEFKLNPTSSNSYALRENNRKDSQYIVEISRSTVTGNIILEGHCLNLDKIGRVGFNGYNFVMGKQVKCKFRYEDCILVNEENPLDKLPGFMGTEAG